MKLDLTKPIYQRLSVLTAATYVGTYKDEEGTLYYIFASPRSPAYGFSLNEYTDENVDQYLFNPKQKVKRWIVCLRSGAGEFAIIRKTKVAAEVWATEWEKFHSNNNGQVSFTIHEVEWEE